MNCVCCDHSMIVYDKNSYLILPVYFCKNCGSYATGDSETTIKDKTVELYKKEYWDERTSERSLESDYSDADSQGKKRRWLSQQEYCKPFFTNKKNLLEIGSGAGQTLFWFESMGFHVIGIEPDERNVRLINAKLKKGKCVTGFAEDFQIDGKFDIIWLSHVFEHVIQPETVLKKITQKLNDNGVLFIEVPNCENKTVLHESIYNNPSTYHFSKKGLLGLAKKTGCDVLKCDYFRSPTLLEGIINRIMKKYLYFLGYNPYKYYPKIITNNHGTDIRLILKTSNK